MKKRNSPLMISLEEMKQVLPHAFLLVRFEPFPEIGAAFCLDTDEKGEARGLTLKGVRQGTHQPFFMKEDLVPRVFQPVVTAKKGQHKAYTLQLQPLTEKLDLLCTQPRHCKCLFPLREEKKKIKIEHIMVTGSLMPPEMVFHVHGTYRSRKDAPLEYHQKSIVAPKHFTELLLHSLKGL